MSKGLESLIPKKVDKIMMIVLLKKKVFFGSKQIKYKRKSLSAKSAF